MRPRAALLSTLALVLALAGCGASSLSASQLRHRAAHICAVAQRRTTKIPTPTSTTEEAGYLSAGIAAFTPELEALRRLHPPAGLADQYRAALHNDTAAVRALHRTFTGLAAGDDPVVAIKTLQEQLTPLERRGQLAWAAVGIRSCESS